MRVGRLQAADLLFHADGAAVLAPHQRAHQLSAQALQIAFERHQFPVVLHQHALVRSRLGPHRREEHFVLLVLAQPRRVGAHDAHPHRAEEFALEPLLRVRLPDDGALEVEELAVDRLEQREEGRAVGELGIDAFFKHAQELVERPVQSLMRALGSGGPEEIGKEGA